ncbi:hypothetical protein LguiB_016582 [Lonicera macranthoides]
MSTHVVPRIKHHLPHSPHRLSPAPAHNNTRPPTAHRTETPSLVAQPPGGRAGMPPPESAWATTHSPKQPPAEDSRGN